MLKHNTIPQLIDLAIGDTLSQTLEILWNCLQTERGYSIAFTLSTESHISALKLTFESLITKCHRQRDKQLRNELVIILTKIVELNPEALVLYRVTGLQDLIVSTLSREELGTADIILAQTTLVYLYK